MLGHCLALDVEAGVNGFSELSRLYRFSGRAVNWEGQRERRFEHLVGNGTGRRALVSYASRVRVVLLVVTAGLGDFVGALDGVEQLLRR